MNELIIHSGAGFSLAPAAQDAIAALEAQIKDLREREKQLKERLYEAMEAEDIIKIETPDLSITRVLPTHKESFNAKALRKDDPDLYDKYVYLSPVKGSLRIKVKTDEDK